MRFTVFLTSLLVLASCNEFSMFAKYEKKDEGIDKAAQLMEEGRADEAKAELRKLMPSGAIAVIDSDVEPANTSDFAVSLATEMEGVENGAGILSVYANAEAQTTDVNALNIVVELVKIDDEKKKSSSLRLTDEDDALVIFFPAMPKACQTSYVPVHRGLDKAIAILYAAAILRGFPKEQVSERLRELRASMIPADQLNGAIFGLVNFICPSLTFDTDSDFVVNETEAAAITDTEAEALYDRMVYAIDGIQAMVDANPDEKNMKKALERTQKYKTIIDSMDASLSRADRVRSFLVSQTNR